MKIVTVEQMQRLEESSASEGVSTDTLIESAGLAVAKVASRELGSAAGRRILVLVGPGNNGGDGLVAARHLQRWGAEVTAWVPIPRRDEDPKLTLALEYGVHVLSAKDDSTVKDLDAMLARADLVIDAVLGTGKARPLEGTIKEAMKQLRASRERNNTNILALDLPTGLNADTGETDPACLDADVTVALGYPKTGHFRFPGAAKLGRLEVVDIGIPRHVGENIRLEMLTSDWVRGKLPQRPPSAHKGTFGRALVVAGSRNYVGAASLTAQAAARVGPGLVTLASPESIYPFLATKLTEIIHMPLPDDRPEDGKDRNVTIHPDAAGVIKKSIRNYDSMVVGCGLGNSEGLIEFMRKLLMAGPQPEIPILIDADGLNNMSAIKDWWQRLKSPVMVTPHPGEMSTLTGVPTLIHRSGPVGDRHGMVGQMGTRGGVEGGPHGCGRPRWSLSSEPLRQPSPGIRRDRGRSGRNHRRAAGPRAFARGRRWMRGLSAWGRWRAGPRQDGGYRHLGGRSYPRVTSRNKNHQTGLTTGDSCLVLVI